MTWPSHDIEIMNVWCADGLLSTKIIYLLVNRLLILVVLICALDSYKINKVCLVLFVVILTLGLLLIPLLPLLYCLNGSHGLDGLRWFSAQSIINLFLNSHFLLIDIQVSSIRAHVHVEMEVGKVKHGLLWPIAPLVYHVLISLLVEAVSHHYTLFDWCQFELWIKHRRVMDIKLLSYEPLKQL